MLEKYVELCSNIAEYTIDKHVQVRLERKEEREGIAMLDLFVVLPN